MKTLYLLRHANSEYPFGLPDDRQRPLNKRGIDSCKLIGSYIKENNLFPERILCSDTVRTTMTANNVFRAANANIPITPVTALYQATAGEILKTLTNLDDDVQAAMVVCHNPGIEQLAKLLLGNGDEESIALLKLKYPTTGLACFRLETDSWKTINPGCGTLNKFVTPKSLGL